MKIHRFSRNELNELPKDDLIDLVEIVVDENIKLNHKYRKMRRGYRIRIAELASQQKTNKNKNTEDSQ